MDSNKIKCLICGWKGTDEDLVIRINEKNDFIMGLSIDEEPKERSNCPVCGSTEIEDIDFDPYKDSNESDEDQFT